jgi:glycosyltransferase involved in cell wall biosynthesis
MPYAGCSTTLSRGAARMSERPLSFCMVTTFYPPYHFGGEAMYLYHLTNELALRGHEVTVVHCVDSFNVLTSEPPRGDFPQRSEVTVERLHSPLGALSPVVTYVAGTPGLKARQLKRILTPGRFDVVHFHLVTLVGGPGVLRYGDGIKLYTTHDHWLVCPMYDLWRYNRELCDRRECLRCTLSFRRPPQLWRYTRWQRHLANVDLFLSPSRSTIEQHRARGFPYPMQHLPYFLPAGESAEPAPDRPEPARPYFLFVGRLVKLKGVQTLIEAFRRYDSADLLIAGDGVYGDELRRQAEGLEHVRFLGRVHPRELLALNADAVAVLVPSLAYETFGLIGLEAFAQRTPVIANDHGAVREVVEESGGGLTYSSIDELAAALTRVQSDHELRSELGERGYGAYQRLWTAGPHLERYFAAIDEARELRRSRASSKDRA